MKLKRSKSWDMRYHLLRDAEKKSDIDVFWGKGSGNLADYYFKHFPPSYHTDMGDSLFVPPLGTPVQRSSILRPRFTLRPRASLPLCTAPSVRSIFLRNSLVSRILWNVLSTTTLQECVLLRVRQFNGFHRLTT